MDREQVINVLENLAFGIDPATGHTIPYDAFHATETVRALFMATTLLKESAAPQGRRRSASTKLTAAGAPWTQEEDERLVREFDDGLTAAQMALEHGRSSGAITSRLVKLGKIDPATVTSRDRGARVVAAMG